MTSPEFPKISIVIPSYNQGQYIEQTLTSIAYQNYPNLEVIVVDGGSTDQTLAVLEKYQHQLTHCISEPDNGQADAINKGFRLATGDVLGWLNSDDMYLPCTLSKAAQILKDYRKPKLIYGGCLHFRESKAEAFGIMPIEFDRDRLTYFDYITQPSTFWSRSLWEKVGELNDSYYYTLDWDWFIRASKVCDFTPVHDYLSIYRLHENHKTGTGGTKRAKEMIKIVENYASEEWKSAYIDVEPYAASLRVMRGRLSKIGFPHARILFHSHIYLKYGQHRVDTVLSMI